MIFMGLFLIGIPCRRPPSSGLPLNNHSVLLSRVTSSEVGHSGVIRTAKVILMNSSFLSIVSRAPRALSATSAKPRASTQLDSSKMAASRASWFSLILKSREGSRSELGMGDSLFDENRVAVWEGYSVGRAPGRVVVL